MQAPSVANAEWFVRPETRAVFGCLNRHGFEVRAVGGAIRDSLLGIPVTEVDFATTAKPEDIVRLAEAASIRTIPTGIAHGTVTLAINGALFEVTSLRRDVETDGRHAIVAYGSDWTEDARRRDFTINALFADANGAVHDPLGEGLRDLEARLVRFVGDADARIGEDYLRILRFFRFSAHYAEGDFDAEAIAAAIRARAGLSRLSRERIRSEVLRIIVARRAGEALRIMDESGILPLLLGGAVSRGRFERICAIETGLGFRADTTSRLAALAVFVEEDAGRLAARLRLSGAEAADLSAAAGHAPPVSGDLDREALEAALYRLGAPAYLRRLLLAWAGKPISASDPTWRRAALLAEGWERPKFPITGGDLLALGWKPGPGLGDKLRALEDRWIGQGFRPSREALLALAGQD